MSVPIAEKAPAEPDVPVEEPVVVVPGLVVLGAEDVEACTDGSCW